MAAPPISRRIAAVAIDVIVVAFGAPFKSDSRDGFATIGAGLHGAVDRLGILKVIQSGDGRIVFATSDGGLWTLDLADRGPSSTGRPV
jgi:hypothetical protein